MDMVAWGLPGGYLGVSWGFSGVYPSLHPGTPQTDLSNSSIVSAYVDVYV